SRHVPQALGTHVFRPSGDRRTDRDADPGGAAGGGQDAGYGEVRGAVPPAAAASADRGVHADPAAGAGLYFFPEAGRGADGFVVSDVLRGGERGAGGGGGVHALSRER